MRGGSIEVRTNSPFISRRSPASKVFSAVKYSVVRAYRDADDKDSPGTSLEIALIVRRPALTSCSVAIWRASWATTTSPARIASRSLMRSVTVATAAAKVVASMPSS